MISKKSLAFFAGLFLLAMLPQAFPQNRISSPYSRYGLGELNSANSDYSAGMGGISAGLRSSSFININNPASYSAFDSNSFMCEVSVVSRFTQLQSVAQSQDFVNQTSVGHLVFGFPVTRWWATSLGVVPYSKTGYKILAYDTLDNIGKVTEMFDGRGGVNKAYLGMAFRPFRNFSIGANLCYLFGTIYQNRTVYLPDQAYSFNIRVKENLTVGSLYFNYGLQYQINLPKNYYLVLGTAFDLPFNISAKRTYIAERFAASGEVESIKDSVVYRPDEKGKIHMPLMISGGLTLRKSNIWMVGADFNWQQWSRFRSFGEADSIDNSWGVALGGEITPKANAGRNYWKKMSYRLGLKYNQSYLELRNSKITQLGVSVGLGFPIRKIRTTINLAIEAGKTGKIQSNLIQENYIRLVLGINFKEPWFFRPKLN